MGRTTQWVAPTIVILMLTLGACGDDTAEPTATDAAVDDSSEPAVDLPPTTYLAQKTGAYAGHLDETEGLTGTIDFVLVDTGTGKTLAEGQITDVAYQIVDIRIVLVMDGFRCSGGPVHAETELMLPGPFPMTNSSNDFEATGSGLTVSGTHGFGMSVAGTLAGSLMVGSADCVLDRVTWRSPEG
jgi:hypothetical protein